MGYVASTLFHRERHALAGGRWHEFSDIEKTTRPSITLRGDAAQLHLRRARSNVAVHVESI